MRFRPFRMVRGSHSAERTKGMRPEAEESARSTRRVMWEITDSKKPNATFLLFEDNNVPKRAEMSRDAHERNSRWHCHVVSPDFATLLRHTNLPGPLGTPPGTLGPNAWIQRGASITIEGLSFSIQLRPSLSGSLGQAVEQSECIISIGNLIVGTDRIVGGVVELQYEPLQRLSANSSLLGSLLVELLPPILSTVLRSVPVPKDDNLPLSNSAAVRTMLPTAQMDEIVPASLDEWRDPQQSQESMDSKTFPAWESEVDYEPDILGWSGFEQRRRMAFVYLNMLRSEGLA